MSDRFERGDGRRIHPVHLTLVLAPEPEVDAGTNIVLKIRAGCPHGCDLRGEIVNVVASGSAVVVSAQLSQFGGGVNETDECVFAAPDEVGDHVWMVVLPACEAGGLLHDE